MFTNPYSKMLNQQNTEETKMKKITIEISEDELSKIAGGSAAVSDSELEKAIQKAVEKMVDETQNPLLVKIVESLDFPAIVSDVQDELDYERIVERVLEEIDTTSITEEVMENLDYSDIIDKLDYDAIAEYIDTSKVTESIDFYNVARDLLSEYSPGNSCRTGEAFTEAIQHAISYIFQYDEGHEYELNQAVKNIVKIGLKEIELEQEALRIKNQILHEEMIKMKQMVSDLQSVVAKPDYI